MGVRFFGKKVHLLFLVFLLFSFLSLVFFNVAVLLKNLHGVSFLVTFVLSFNFVVVFFLVIYLFRLGIGGSFRGLGVSLFFLSFLVVAELVFANFDVTFGLVLHVVIMLLAVLSPFYLSKKSVGVAQAFLLVSLLRLVNVGLPLEGISVYYQFLIIYSLLLLSLAVYLYRLDFRLFDLGIRSGGFVGFVFFGVLLGVLLGFTEYTVLGVTRVFPTFFLASLSVFFILGLVEELIFRGVLLKSMIHVDPFFAILFSSVAFAVMHSVWVEPLEYVFTFYAGFVLAVVYYKTDSLIWPITTHVVINFLLFQVIPFRLL